MDNSLLKRVQSWLDQVESTVRPYLPPGNKLIVGVSGGPDSLALLHLLQRVFSGTDLVAAHLHHGWRPEADSEAQQVADTAVRWGITFEIKRLDVPALAVESGLTLEEAGRKARYDFFAELARQIGTKIIAVGHHADDQVETMLMNLLRGSGLDGLQGMKAVSPLPGALDLSLIRPLLITSRREIERYCQSHDLQPTFDASNEDVTYFRNRIRHELLPILNDYNPQIGRRLINLAELVSADVELLDSQTQAAWQAIALQAEDDDVTLEKAGWQSLPLSLRRRTLRQAIAALRSDLENVGLRSIEQARLVADAGKVGSLSALPGGLVLQVGYDHLTVTGDPNLQPTKLPQLLGETAEHVSIPATVQLANGWVLTVTPVEKPDLSSIRKNPDPWTAFVDLGETTHLFIRGRLLGEKFQPLGLNGRTGTVKEMMINRKMGRSSRPLWPIVAVDEHLVWIVGHQLDERVRVGEDSQQVVRLRCHRDHEK